MTEPAPETMPAEQQAPEPGTAPDPAPAPQETPPEQAAPAEPPNTETPVTAPAETAQLPDVLAPNEGAGTEAAPSVVHPGVSNASATLTPGAQAAAGRTYGLLSHMEAVIAAAKADIERYVPPEVLNLAQAEALAAVRTLL